MQPSQRGVVQEIIKIDNLSSTKVTTLGCQVCRGGGTQLLFRLEPFSRDRNPSQLNQCTKNKNEFGWLLMQLVDMYEHLRFINKLLFVAWVFGW